MKKRLLCGTVLVSLASGCYQYQTYDAGRVQAGQVVQVTLTSSGATALAPSIGPSATQLDGRVLALGTADVTLGLTQITRAVGPEQFLHEEPVLLPVGGVESWRVRAFDKSRTALMIGGVVAAVLAGQVFMDQSGLFSARGTVSQGTK